MIRGMVTACIITLITIFILESGSFIKGVGFFFIFIVGFL